MKSWLIPRRTFLKGAGVSLLLPALDIMLPTEAHAEKIMGPRFAALFMSTGIYGRGFNPTATGFARYTKNLLPANAGGQGTWRPANTGAFPTTLPLLLQDLNDYRSKFSIISGLDQKVDALNHSNGTISWLTAPAVAAPAGTTTPPVSLDQAIANYYKIPYSNTLVFSPSTGDFQEGKTGGHVGRISSNPNAGGNHCLTPSTDPLKRFDIMIKGCHPQTSNPNPTPTPADPTKTRNSNILDAVSENIKTLNKKLSAEDKLRMEAYYAQIQSIQSNYKQDNNDNGSTTGGEGTLGDNTCATKPAAYSNWYQQISAMVDVAAFSLASDLMPIATIMTAVETVDAVPYAPFVNNSAIVKNFRSISGNPVAYPAGALIHTVAHNSDGQDNNQAKLSTQEMVDNIEYYIAYNIMVMTFARRLIEKLDKLPKDPNGKTPLENSFVLVGCCHSDGASHSYDNIPTLLAGGSRYGFKTGQHLAAAKGTDIGNLYYTMMRKMGCNIADFNGKKTMLSGLFT